MANYKEIKGFGVQNLSSDAVASQASGGSWASGGTLNTNQRGMNAGFGLQTAAICVGGITSPGAVTDVVEKYDGSSWTEVGDINTV